ncbi:MAG: hypothetical protein EPN40_03815 [Rhodanobacteraceae bacterium]|nr:MAG: hypothetical protein EPN40_03815 [Rhodanobacteraceae bacterium]
MKARHPHTAVALAATLAVFAAASPAQAFNPLPIPASWKPAALRLTGVWTVQVTLINCKTLAPLMPPFAALNQFGVDGSEFEVGIATPPSQRYPSFGTWHYAGLNKYHSDFTFFRFNPDGSFAGTQDVSRDIKLSPDGNSFTSLAEVSIYDAQHNLVKTPCATETANRF